MDDFIILPDDDSLAKLSAEYSKIRAKTFSDEAVTALDVKTPPAPTYNGNYFLVTFISAVILKSIISK